ncbi:ABC transporter ATP-binding protein [Nonomuraea longicatena]|uniref:ABC transporter ATP-binding protein n=1 Tax=Nonomuraea longicatena TaxID=83682 RepID=A0ABP3Z7G0_9ACTN
MKGTGPLLSFTEATRRFGSVRALDPVTLAVGRGEFVSVIGPSGCGKSTLLRLASGLDQASSGAVRTATDEVAYVFQDATLMPWRTVRRNVELLGELSGAGREDVRRRAQAALEAVGLADFAGHLPRQLSGGMRMRASLARALVMEPVLFLFDEPFGALDEITRTRLNLQLMDLFVERGFGALFVTHSVEESVFLSGRVVVMSARPGRITAEFTVPFAFPRPAELRYTAEFADLAGKVAGALEEAS